MTLQKQDGGLHPILCGEIWRRCFACLTVNETPVLHETAKIFTSAYDIFIQRAGIRVSGMVFHTTQRFSRFFYETL